MANIKSAKKRILTSTKRAKGVLHKNTASRKVSRLAQAVNKIG